MLIQQHLSRLSIYLHRMRLPMLHQSETRQFEGRKKFALPSTLRESKEIMWEIACTSMIMYVYVELYIKGTTDYRYNTRTLYIYI